MAAVGTVVAVRALVYDAVFKRAQEIAASDKLRSVVYEGEGLLKGTAECVGSSPSDLYVVSVSIDGATPVGDCSCPAGKSAKSGLCKHVVALLLRRIQELKEPQTSPSENPPEELVLSISSQIDDIVTKEDAENVTSGGGIAQSNVPKRLGPSASSSKRALPAWMLGVVGSDSGAEPSSSKPKSNKRNAGPKPPRPAPPPAKRVRRSGQPLKISNESDEGEGVHDPGEVDDAAPMDMEKCPPPVVTEDDEGPETIDIRSEGAAARERRRLRALKKEVVVAEDDGNEGVKRTRSQSSRAVNKEVIEEPVRASKRKRLAKKYVEEDNGFEDGDAPVHVNTDAGDGFGLTDEDLMFLALEQLEKEKPTLEAEGARMPKAPEERVEEEKPTQNCSQGKQSSSMFSMSKWKEMSSEARGPGGTSSLATGNCDWETLKNYSLEANSHSASQVGRLSSNDTVRGLLPSLQTAEPAMVLKDIPAPTQITSRSDEIGTVANDMLDIFFGSTQSKDLAKNSPTASSGPSFSQGYQPNYYAAEVGLEAPLTSISVPQSGNFAPTVSAVGNDLHGIELRPKKKSSLKNRVEMLLS